MADPSDNKLLKTTQEDDDNVDRLSALPDCVLVFILSRFRTKDAAVTSVLSRRWRNLFVFLPEIDLIFYVDEHSSDADRLFSDFIDFASKVIRQRNKAAIRKIKLFVNYFSERHQMAFGWLLKSVAAAISSYNVQELRIEVLIGKTKPFSLYIPPGILTCKTLVSLSLILGVDWTVPDLVCLPNLKVLCLEIFRLADEGFIGKFLQGCPLLEQFILHLGPLNNESKGDKVLDISGPSLKNVELFYWGFESEFSTVVKSKNLEHLCFLLRGQHKVTIGAPNLRSLKIDGPLLEVNVIQSLMSLDDALVELDFLCCVGMGSNIISLSEHVFKFVRELQNVKSISFSEGILIALYFSRRVLPTFRNLIKLQLCPFDCPTFPHECMSSVLSNLFESSPNLEVLIFSEVSKNYFSEDEELDSVLWEAFPLVLVEHLKEIEIRMFKGEEHELKLVEFFLESGKSLKKMTLFGYACASSSKGLDRILSFNKCSDDCQIVSKEQ